MVGTLVLSAACLTGSLWFCTNYAVGLNFTESVPQKVFLIERGNRDLQVGDYVAFEAPSNRFFPGRRFVKRVAGVEGSQVQHVAGHVFVDGQEIGPIQTATTNHQPLFPGPQGVIPQGAFFAAGTHGRSYDSRYESIGFVPLGDVVGRAYPLF